MATALEPLPATAADLFALAEEARFHELVDGDLVQKGAPTGEHGNAQGRLLHLVGGPYHRRPSDRWPGGWWILVEVEVQLDERNVLRPDVVGWRRERIPECPKGTPVAIRPDWVCEILSTRRSNDLIRKKRIYHRHVVPHYSIVDPEEESLSVNRYSPDGYIEVLTALRGERVRAEPFAAIELAVGVLFGDEPED